MHAAESTLPFSMEHDFSGGTNVSTETEPSHIRHIQDTGESAPENQALLLLFVRSSCPGCSPAKDAAERLGIPVNLMNADTKEGKAEAVRRRVLSTPTAILLSPGGEELARAVNVEAIGRLRNVQAVTV